MTAFPLAAAAAALAAAAEDPAPAKLFADNCASCHAVPDPGLAADRPWIDQVRRTA
jgi:mono/diheme cytochrome c family protein